MLWHSKSAMHWMQHTYTRTLWTTVSKIKMFPRFTLHSLNSFRLSVHHFLYVHYSNNLILDTILCVNQEGDFLFVFFLVFVWKINILLCTKVKTVTILIYFSSPCLNQSIDFPNGISIWRFILSIWVKLRWTKIFVELHRFLINTWI